MASSAAEAFCFSIPKNKGDRALDLYVEAVKYGRRALGDSSSKVLKSIRAKKFRPNAFLEESKESSLEPALLIAQICGLMDAQRASSRTMHPQRDKPLDIVPKKKPSNGTGFAGHSSDTIVLSAQIFSARLQHVEQERALAKMIGATNKFLERCFLSSASWQFFGALQKFLLPLLQKLLRNMSWRDIAEDSMLCEAILDLFSSWTTTALLSNATMLSLLLLDPLVELDGENFEVTTKLGDCILVTLIAAIDDQAQQFYRLKNLHEKDVGKPDTKRIARVPSWITKRVKPSKKEENKLKQVAEKLHALRLRLGELVRVSPAKQLWDAIKIRYCGRKTLALVKDGKDLTLQNLKAVGVKNECADEMYCKALGSLRLTCADIADHHRLFRQPSCTLDGAVGIQVVVTGAGMPNVQFLAPPRISDDPLPVPAVRRLQSELSTLATALPLNWGSSIFVCIDDSNMGVLKVAIIGPNNTPYKNGIFVFDVKISTLYPSVPPRVVLRTTGNDTVRFNPNLYQDGHVCLSLLGTWSGPGWDATFSTLLQLLLSIQSLIFVEQPYFNEPGSEINRDRSIEKLRSAQYDTNIRHMTLKWAILDQIKNPPLGFEKVAATHFNLKAKEIGEQLEEWELLDPRISCIAAEVRKKLGIPEIRKKLACSRVSQSLKRPASSVDRPKKILKKASK